MAEVALEHVTKTYGKRTRTVTALRELTLAAADGELLVLVGPSGCGKTTTLRLIAGLEAPSAGTIRMAGTVVNDVPPQDRDVAMVFQDHALYPHMTVRRNLAFGLKMRGVPRAAIRDRVTEAARRLGIGHLMERRPGSLSGGECQRVALGRAIVRQPRAFLLDEPLSSLDAQLRARMRSEIKNLKRDLRATMIYVTHDQAEAMTLGDRIAVLRDGELQQCGPPMQVYKRPANRFVAGFIGTPPMNFLPGRLEANGEAAIFVHDRGRIALEPGPAPAADGVAAVLGLRPEDLHLAIAGGVPPEAPTSRVRLTSLGSARVTLVEPLGDTGHVHVAWPAGGTLVVRAPSAGEIGLGTEVEVLADARRAHLFHDAGSGERIPWGGEA
jgi:multiple sugar transport system ATP-binding protein